MRVLAHLSVHPEQPIREAARFLGVADSTIRSIKSRWGETALQTGAFGQHAGAGRPVGKPRRWKRCATPLLWTGTRAIADILVPPPLYAILYRQLGRLSNQHPFMTSRWLAREMVKWEMMVNSSRPSGARCLNPKPVARQTICNYLNELGIRSCR